MGSQHKRSQKPKEGLHLLLFRLQDQQQTKSTRCLADVEPAANAEHPLAAAVITASALRTAVPARVLARALAVHVPAVALDRRPVAAVKVTAVTAVGASRVP